MTDALGSDRSESEKKQTEKQLVRECKKSDERVRDRSERKKKTN